MVGLHEVPGVALPLGPNQRSVGVGVNLVAATSLPDNIPGFGGSEVQIAGVIGTSLPEMVIEGKIVLADPPVIADVLALDSFGLEIRGTPSLAIFGDGRILHEKIPFLDEDIGVRATLRLDILHTTLSGSLSLLNPIEDLFGAEGLNIIEGDGEFGINFATTPLPLPTFGFNLLMELPDAAQDLLGLPARARRRRTSSARPSRSSR